MREYAPLISEIFFKFTIILVIVIFSLSFLAFTAMFIQMGTLKEYKTNKIVDCNDKDGDIIPELTCYQKIKCSERLKFLNNKECVRFVGR